MSSFVLLVFFGFLILAGSAYVTYKWDWKGPALLIPAVLLLPFMVDISGSIPGIISPVVIGSLAGFTFKKRLSLGFYVPAAALLMTLVYTGNFYYLKKVKNFNIITESKTEMLEIIKRYDMPADKKKEIMENIDTWIEITEDIIPFSFFMNSLIVSALGYMLVKVLFARIFGEIEIKGLEYFRLNDYAIFFLIAGWLLFLLADKSDNRALYRAGLNTGLILSALYFIQAVGVIRFILIKNKKSVFILPFMLIITLILGIEAFVFMIILLAGFGALDLWADFRKLNTGSTGQI